MERKLASFAPHCQRLKNLRTRKIMMANRRAVGARDVPRSEVLTILLLLVSYSAVFAGGAGDRLSRTNLLACHNAEGSVSPVKSKRDWERRRAEILDGCQQI